MKTKCLETFPWKHLNLKTGNQWNHLYWLFHRTNTLSLSPTRKKQKTKQKTNNNRPDTWKSHRTRTRKVKQSDSSLLSDILQAQTQKTDCSERTSQSQRPFVFTNLNLWSKVPIPATGDGSNLEERMSTNLPNISGNCS